MPQSPTRTTRLLLTSAVVTAGGVGLLALPAGADTLVPRPESFTSAFTVSATPQEVVGMDGAVGIDNPSASGTFNLQLNSEMNIICYNIRLQGVDRPFMSPARTSTHIHEAGAGQSGPPRIVFPDPVSPTDPAVSSGCMQGPFTTGATSDAGSDTGEGFTVAELEADPADYYVDVHTAAFVPGAVRGQISSAAAAAPPAAQPPAAAPPAEQAPAAPPAAQAPADQSTPVGGVAAGFGGLSAPSTLPATAALAAALVVLGTGLTASVWGAGRAPAGIARGRRER